jgi:phosphoinositide-3-kinase regulatory subunit 4
MNIFLSRKKSFSPQMGNQLSIAPSQIFPVEHYLTGLENEVQFESNLGSTRFFKVARAKSDEGGLVVVKVFVKHDPTLPLEVHEESIESIKKKLQNAVNCLPFQKVVVSHESKILLCSFPSHHMLLVNGSCWDHNERVC